MEQALAGISRILNHFCCNIDNAYSHFAGGNASYGNPSQDTSFILCTKPS